MMRFPELPEAIKSFDDIVKINSHIFELIPWTVVPVTELVTAANIETLWQQFKLRQRGGWCGLHAETLQYVLQQSYGLTTRIYNFGIDSFSHVVVIVTWNEEYLFDPYFAKHYGNLSFESLKQFIIEGRFEAIKSAYGDVHKPVEIDGNWELWTPQKLEASVMEGFRALGYDEFMTSFKTNNFENLLLCPL